MNSAPKSRHPRVTEALRPCQLHIYTSDSLAPFTAKLIFLELFSPPSIYQPPSISSQLSVPYLRLADSPLSGGVQYWQE